MPRFYGFDGSTGMDLRPVGQLEAEDAARRERERRRHPMPVTTRIRLVSQPPEGLLPLSLFDRVGLADRKSLYPRSMETVPPDLAGLYVDYMTRVAMGTSVRVAFHVPLLGARLVGQGEYAESLLSRVTDFSPASARAACLLLDFDAASRRGPQYWRPRHMVPDDATYFNLTRMVPGRVPFSTSMVRSCGTVSTSRAGIRTGSRRVVAISSPLTRCGISR